MKERIDVLLVEKGFFESREKAKRAIMAGIVYDQYDRIDKPGTKIDVDTNLFVKGNTCPYVSRGGFKLEKALNEFKLDITDQIMVDIGSSTGGFTDCALQHHAKLVYAVDVGTNQLVWKLRNDPRVIVMEQINFRYATIDLFQSGIPTFATIDVSFISLKYIFSALSTILEDGSLIVALIKPQFEAGRDEVGKKGIVKEKEIHKKVIANVIEYGIKHHLYIKDLSFSPITGGQGNIEFLGLFEKNGRLQSIDIEKVVNHAHMTLKG